MENKGPRAKRMAEIDAQIELLQEVLIDSERRAKLVMRTSRLRALSKTPSQLSANSKKKDPIPIAQRCRLQTIELLMKGVAEKQAKIKENMDQIELRAKDNHNLQIQLDSDFKSMQFLLSATKEENERLIRRSHSCE